MYRGSRKHILDWTGMGDEKFRESLNVLLDGTGARVRSQDYWMPRGHDHPEEGKLDKQSSTWLDSTRRGILRDWWLQAKQGANVPNWDLLSKCEVDGQEGLILIEAKAHAHELNSGGKPLKAKASEASRANHRRIGEAIREACEALRESVPTVNVTRDSHYQLANRVAFSWKLASLGVPNVLVYLGFVGDAGIVDVGRFFENDEDWRRVFDEYCEGVLPNTFLNRRIVVDGTPIQMVARSRRVLNDSPPRTRRR